MPLQRDQDGFSLIELVVILVIIGVLAAIAIPRFLSQQERARDAAAVSDLRNLVSAEVALEAAGGLSQDPESIAAEGWTPSDSRIVACAEVSPAGDDVTLTVWHLDGSTIYSWQRSTSTILATEAAIPHDCDAGTGGTAATVS